jgi:hypothetical protein
MADAMSKRAWALRAIILYTVTILQLQVRSEGWE